MEGQKALSSVFLPGKRAVAAWVAIEWKGRGGKDGKNTIREKETKSERRTVANQLLSLTWEVDLNTVYMHMYPQPSSNEALLGRHSLPLFSTFFFNSTPIPDLEIIRNFIPMLPQVTSTPSFSTLYALGSILSAVWEIRAIVPGRPLSNLPKHKSILFPGFLAPSLTWPLFKCMCMCPAPTSASPTVHSLSLPKTPLHSVVPRYKTPYIQASHPPSPPH